MRQEKLPVFHWHKHNHFRLLPDGNQFFPAMLDAIAGAQHSVLLELYLFESGRVADHFIAALIAAAQRQVATRVMIDALGSRALDTADRERLRTAGIELHVFNPLQLLGDRLHNLVRDHRKLLVVDDQVAFVGGAGITDAFSPDISPEDYWRETMIEIRGAVVQDWAQLFANAWVRAGNKSFRIPTRHAALPADCNQRGRVAISHGLTIQDVKRHALLQIGKARERVWLATPYFLPALSLRRALTRAAQRGVDVRLVLPGALTDHPLLRLISHHYYAQMLRHGIRIFEYQPRFIHSKTLMVDDWVSIGSCNFDRWNLRWNLEANQEVQDSHFARDVELMFIADIGQTREIAADAWAKRRPVIHLFEKLLAAAGNAVERWLNRR